MRWRTSYTAGIRCLHTPWVQGKPSRWFRRRWSPNGSDCAVNPCLSYVNYRNKHKLLPCDRPPINTPEDIALACYADGKGWKANFEYFMNREYAYNRDKGKCKCCGKPFSLTVPKHCHHIDNQLPIERINKVPNLAWLYESCHRMVHNSPIPPELDAKVVRKIMKYREKLKP